MTIMAKIREEREDAAIKTTIITLKRLNFPDNVIIDNIIKNCSLTEEEAKEALLNYEKRWHLTYFICVTFVTYT